MPTFLYTDIEGSTQLWEKHEDTMGVVMDRHDTILLDNIAAFGGRQVKHTGDGMFIIFDGSNPAPLVCALEIQRQLAKENWTGIDELRVRMALHAGPAEPRAGDYFGPAVNRLARLLGVAWGGQIILTPEVVAVYPLPAGASLQDLGVHQLKDLAEPQPIFGLLHPDLPLREFPALRSLSSRPNNLPPQPTPLVGRERELIEVGELLAKPDCRLLTLVAPGGMGKTRLGLQAAAEQIDFFRNGVFFVPLAGVTSAENIPSSVAKALNLSFYGAEDLASQLYNYLREKELLLLLDNFEHLLDGAGTVSAILAQAPKVKILVTSRRRLSLHAEWTFDVLGLPVPDMEDLSAASDFGSVALFLQSARRVHMEYEPSPAGLQAIIRLCHLVDGMPLAIELAAAWVNTLSPEEIEVEIKNDLDMLSTEMYDVPRRQRSLRVIFEHAWNDLSASERGTFSKLSVFRGGFTRDAAQQVTGATFRILAELINKSLLTRDNTGRFHVHELLRQFAAEKLDEDTAEKIVTKEQHATYFSSLLKTFEEPFIRGQRIDPIEGIIAELDNILLAWRWTINHCNLPLLEEGMRSLFWYYEARALYSDGEDAFKSAVQSLTGPNGPLNRQGHQYVFLRRQLLMRQAWFASRLAKHKEARQILPEDDHLFYIEKDQEGGWVYAGTQINTLYGMGQYEAARTVLEKFDARNEQDYQYGRTWPWSKGQTLTNLGRIASALGEYNKARELLEEGLEMLRPVGDHVGVMLYLHNLGRVERILGDTEAARRHFQESLELAEAYHSPMGEALAQSDLGTLAYEEGQYLVARDNFSVSQSLAEEIGDSRGQALALTNLGRIANALGEYEEALKLYEQSLEITTRSGNRRGLALTLIRLSEVHRLLGKWERAAELCRESRSICEELGYRKGTILACIAHGELALAQENYPDAQQIFQGSLEDSEQMGFISGAIRSEIGLGRTNLGGGEWRAAEKHLREALMVSEDIHLPRLELSAVVSLAEVFVKAGPREQGVELLAMAAEHPATDSITRQRAKSLLKDLETEFEPADFERLLANGQSLSLEFIREH